MTNNLHMLASAAKAYMRAKNASQASYFYLVGTETDSYIFPSNLIPAGNENYEDIIIYQSTTQVTQVAPDGSIVTYNL